MEPNKNDTKWLGPSTPMKCELNSFSSCEDVWNKLCADTFDVQIVSQDGLNCTKCKIYFLSWFSNGWTSVWSDESMDSGDVFIIWRCWTGDCFLLHLPATNFLVETFQTTWKSSFLLQHRLRSLSSISCVSLAVFPSLIHVCTMLRMQHFGRMVQTHANTNESQCALDCDNWSVLNMLLREGCHNKPCPLTFCHHHSFVSSGIIHRNYCSHLICVMKWSCEKAASWCYGFFMILWCSRFMKMCSLWFIIFWPCLHKMQ